MSLSAHPLPYVLLGDSFRSQSQAKSCKEKIPITYTFPIDKKTDMLKLKSDRRQPRIFDRENKNAERRNNPNTTKYSSRRQRRAQLARRRAALFSRNSHTPLFLFAVVVGDDLDDTPSFCLCIFFSFFNNSCLRLFKHRQGHSTSAPLLGMNRQSTASHQRLENTSDIATLQTVSDDIIVSCLRERFLSDNIYTNVGTSALVAVNPHKYVGSNADSILMKYASDYRNTSEDHETQPPHIFQLANNAYYHMRRTAQDQTIILRFVT